MIYKIKAIVRYQDTKREIVTNIAGCTDAADAEQKMRHLYPGLVKIKTIEEVE